MARELALKHFGGAIPARILFTAAVCASLNLTIAAPQSDKVDFNSQIRPIISAKCYHCHGPDDKSRKAKLRLDVREEAIKDREGIFVIKPGDVKNSEMIRRITAGEDSDDLMPPTKAGHPLKPDEIALLKKWVQEGAPYAAHWSFVKPERPALPRVSNRAWPNNPIDHFILQKLDQNKLKPSPPADRYALIRRLSIDLTGLPPTPAEVDAFIADKSPNAYEKVVDRLLAAPAYGEKWARMWLDIARYADSYGYGQDSMRDNNPWPYREWVIKAFNRNLPFDQFTIDQLAGDLLDHPTEEQLIATCFHRNTMTNVEGGTDDEEWRVAAVKDRAAVTAQAWMGLTMGCAQCHTHKFDPISHKEYYQFYAIFNQTEDNDQRDERPTMPLPTPAQREQKLKLQNQITALEKTLTESEPAVAKELAEWEKSRAEAGLWKTIVSPEIKSAKDTKFKTLDDHSILAVSEAATKDTYTLSFPSVKSANALRLEMLPDDSLPGKGPGRSETGNFALSELTVSVKPTDAKPTRARFVRIELPGKKKILSLAEVQILNGEENIARKGTASQSSVEYDGAATRAVDGNTDGNYDANSTTHTETQSNPWWEVDLGEEKSFDTVVIWNRTGDDLESRLADFQVTALDPARKKVWTTTVAPAPRPSVALHPSERAIALKRATASFNQADYNAADLARNAAMKNGWAIRGGEGSLQTAVFELAEPMPEGVVTLRLKQNYGYQHTLGRFRLALAATKSPALATPQNIDAILAVAAEKRPTTQRAELLKWFQPYAAGTTEIQSKIAAARKELNAITPQMLPVMRELATNKRRVTHLMNKGNFLDPGDEVSPALPAAFNPLPAGAPMNRLGVAKWIMSPDNPLTARVTANRFWGQIFGVGLVETEEDFGTQGFLPTHPELLDWLAVELRDGGWDVKKFLKLIVMSATYQQTARVTPELLAKDPRNKLISRSPRRRLEAEMIRDQALALSGLLTQKIGGPSVYPPQPDGLWRVPFDGNRKYPTSTGKDRYRRGLYTVWRRTIPYPSMTTFDAPSRESCTFRRLPTNTPLQAYVTMNDPVYMEASQALGRRLVNEGGATTEERIRFGLKLVLARPPEKSQVAALMELYEAELARYRGAEKDALKVATDPLGPLPKNLSAPEAAAWTMVGNVLLNLDGVLTKG